ncbi:hypothetical protein F5Y13DRAFT_185306 [Hypoxylon sp. FL1857]|nr:hypothetical protein F5Y13DRAFT_185306 [Hypoxylon sp. FL1857]
MPSLMPLLPSTLLDMARPVSQVYPITRKGPLMEIKRQTSVEVLYPIKFLPPTRANITKMSTLAENFWLDRAAQRSREATQIIKQVFHFDGALPPSSSIVMNTPRSSAEEADRGEGPSEITGTGARPTGPERSNPDHNGSDENMPDTDDPEEHQRNLNIDRETELELDFGFQAH